ncbi:MAG: hypothetical protein U0401_21840 [Anaerolineae bacterium]
MKRFDYFEPATLDEVVSRCCSVTAARPMCWPGASTSWWKSKHVRAPEYVVNIKKIPGMSHLSYDDQTGLRFWRTGDDPPKSKFTRWYEPNISLAQAV